MRNHLEKSGEFHTEVLYSGCKFFKLSGQISICPDGPHMIGTVVKGILHQKIFYRLNLIFWIVMGCGIARFSRRGLKTTET